MRSRIDLLLLSFTLLFWAGCGKAPSIQRLSGDAVVVAFGDSLTSGTGASRSRSYPALLAEITGLKVVNAGVPGEISSSGLKRLPGVLAKHRPDLVIVCHGGNDLLRKLDENRLARNLNSMIEKIHAQGADVILIGVPRPGVLLDTAALYEEVADRTGIPSENEILEEILSTPSLKSDHVHPNADGYKMLAERIASLIDESQSD